MKKIPALVLLSILLVNTAGFYAYYIIALQRIHREMRVKLKTLPDHQLSRLVLSYETFKASRVEDDEIRLNGKMYDIARMTLRGDSVVVFAMHDEKEENFLAFANEIISKPFKQDLSVTGSVLQFITMVFIPGQHIDILEREVTIVNHQSTKHFSPHLIFLERVAPPPWINS